VTGVENTSAAKLASGESSTAARLASGESSTAARLASGESSTAAKLASGESSTAAKLASSGSGTAGALEPVASGAPATEYTADEMMSVASARALRDGAVCFVGIGLPSTAANLARRLHAPNLCLIYESGTVDTRPDELPLSIGDGILVDSALTVVSVPEVFNYWLQPGRIDVGFLSGAQLDRLGNINTTVIGEYDEPSVRLPGSGGAPEIAASCGEVMIVMRHRMRAFVDAVDFVTSVGSGSGPGDRERLGLRGRGPLRVITDLGILEPDPDSGELVLTGLHPGITVEQVRAETGWDLQVGGNELVRTPAPTEQELEVLRSLRTVGS
jgi:glutaconate CoA-transferase subunit B